MSVSALGVITTKNSPLERAVWEASKQRDERVCAEERRRAGVVHTPPELARAQILGLDRMLKNAGLSDGMCSRDLVIVDLACGTGAFVAAVLTHAQANGAGPCAAVATDLDSSSLSVMQELCGSVAAGLGCDLQVRCENSLERGLVPIACRPAWVVVVGNPPWSVAKRQPSAAMQPLLEDFRRDETGQRLLGGKLGVLSDAYVQFFRLAVAYAELGTQGGALGLWTNGSFLDGPTHRGMRRALLNGFSTLEIDDFGGNALLSRDRTLGADENLFEVRTSVALTMAVRTAEKVSAGLHGRALYRRHRGTRASKVAALSGVGYGRTVSIELKSSLPNYCFVPGPRMPRAYAEALAVHEVMPFHREGVQTNRDAMVVADSSEELRLRLQRFVSGEALPEFKSVSSRTSHYDPDVARAHVRAVLQNSAAQENWVLPIAYRPLVNRFFCPVTPLCHRPRPALLRAMANSSLALVTVRRDRGTAPFRHAAIVSHVADSSYLSSRSSCRTRVFPQNTEAGSANLDAQALATISERAERVLQTQDVMALVVALVHCPGYLAKFDGVLRDDFPRMVLPDDATTLRALIDAGHAVGDAFVDGARGEPGAAEVVQVGQHRVCTSPALTLAVLKLRGFEF